MHKFNRFIIYFLAAPLVLIYAALLVFLFINGVSGADNWVIRFWKASKAWWLIVALIAGLISWIVVVAKFLF